MNTNARARGAPKILAALAFGAVSLSVAGCVTTDEVRYGNVVAVPGAYAAAPAQAERPLSIGEIVAHLRSGVAQNELANEIRERGLLAPATDADIDLLLQMGANDDLVDMVLAASAAPPPATMTGPSNVYVTPPPTVIHDYSWYPYAPYAPYAPYNFGLWYYDAPRYAPSHRYRPQRGDRLRPPNQGRPLAPAPGWQGPRVNPAPSPSPSPSPGSAIRPRPNPQLPSAGGNAPNPQWQAPRPSSPRIPQDLPPPRQSPNPPDPRMVPR